MLFRSSVVLAGVALALGGATAATPSPTPSASPTVRPPMTCPPALPVSGGPSAVTPTSVTISYSILLSPPCGYDPPITVTLFASLEEAQQWRDPVAAATSGPERSGAVTLGGLAPDTQYWFRFSAADRRDPYVYASVRTAPLPSCAATAAIAYRWTGGFLATVTVRNVSGGTLDGWRVTWRWSGGERIETTWHAVAESNGADVTARNTSYNGTLAPGGSTTFGVLVAGNAPAGGIAPTCGS